MAGPAACGDVQPEPDSPVVQAVRAEGYGVRISPPLPRHSPPQDTLTVHRVYGDSTSFARVVRLYHRDGRLLVLDQLLSYHLALIDLADGTIKHFGRHGRGPREFMVPFSASWVGDRVWVFDFELNRFSLLDLSGSEPRFERSVPGPSQLQLLDPVMGARLISNTLTEDAALVFTESGTETGRRLVRLPSPFPTDRHPNSLARRMLGRTFLGASPDGTRVALAYQFTNQLEILSGAGHHMATVKGPRPGSPSYRIENGRFFWNDDNISLYVGITTSDRHIYVPYCGCPLAGEQAVSRIHVFDWEGNFVREIALDRVFFSLAVARDDSRLFGFVEEPYPHIAEWSMTDIQLRPRPGSADPVRGLNTEVR